MNLSISERQAGVSLLEVSIAALIGLVVLSAAWQIFSGVAEGSRSGVLGSSAQMHSRRCLDRMHEELSASGSDFAGTNRVSSHPLNVLTQSPSVTFQMREDLLELESDWSTQVRYELQPEAGEDPANGGDDDGDGIIDEQNLVRVQDGVGVVLSTNIIGINFARQIGAYTIDVTMTIAWPDEGDGMGQHAVTSTVYLRNQPQTP